jgi:ATP-dependent helicase/nuclease subunit A
MTATFFVDRSVAPPAGYFRVARRTVGFGEEELARPPGWDDMQEADKRFEEAERIRLLYVAATRAGRMLCVSVRRNKDGRAAGAWEKLDRYLTSSLPGAARTVPAAESAQAGSPERDLDDFRQRRARAGARVASPTYRTASVTAVAHSEAARPAWEHTGKGMGWGRVLHGLLEASMKDPAIDLSACAANLLAEEGRSPGELEEAVRLVQGVRSSDLWRRALASRRCLVEVPFALTAPVEDGGDRGIEEGLLTGAIDLVFQEADAWVVIDYKSDIVGDNREALVDFYRPQVSRYRRYWEKLTGQRTRAGLYFIQTGEEVWID